MMVMKDAYVKRFELRTVMMLLHIYILRVNRSLGYTRHGRSFGEIERFGMARSTYVLLNILTAFIT
jgi:hypothetical protein